MDENYLTEGNLTGHLKAMLLLVEGHIAKEIPDRGTFDPYGILFKQESGGKTKLIFLETEDDSDLVLKGRPSSQMARRIEDKIRHYRNDCSVVSAGLVIDAHLRPQEGGDEIEAVVAWLDDRGVQQVRVMICYELCGREFKITSKTIEARGELFLSARAGKPWHAEAVQSLHPEPTAAHKPWWRFW